MADPVCIVMVKEPTPGSVKTRLTPPLTAEEAAGLATCFAQDTVARVQLLGSKVIIAFYPETAGQKLQSMFPAQDLVWVEQVGDDLGARLDSVMSYAASLGYGPLVAVGTDSPTVPTSFIQTAFDSLNAGEAEFALGRTEDGGFYLVGIRSYRSNLFAKIDWGTALAFEQALRNAKTHRLRTAELPTWYDVDTFPDLLRLRNELATGEESRGRAPATFTWLQTHESQLARR